MASHVIRKKGVSHKGVLVNSNEDGSVEILRGSDLNAQNKLELTEEEALALFDNLSNMIEWKS